jgi:hypothetical protein
MPNSLFLPDMLTRSLFPFLLVFLLGAPAYGQMERTIYHVFEIDSSKTVDLDLLGIYELHSWAGNSILVETNIQIWHASPQILDYLIEKERYAVSADTTSGSITRIYTKDQERKPLKTPVGEVTEIATTKVFIPDTYVWSEDKKHIRRKDE